MHTPGGAGPPSGNSGNSGRSEDFYTNVGDALRTLRRELPTLFYKELTYDIYREDIVFRDPRNVFIGIDRYKTIFKTLRFFAKVFFRPKSLELRIVRIWQPNEGKIVVRWTIMGTPWLALGDDENILDGNSEFKLDRKGKIYEHKVSNLDPTPANYLNVLQNMLNVQMAPKMPTPTYFAPEALGSWLATSAQTVKEAHERPLKPPTIGESTACVADNIQFPNGA